MKKTRAASAKAGKRPEARVLQELFSLPFILLVFVLVTSASLILLRGSVRGLSDPDFFGGPGSFFLFFASPFALIALGLALFYVFASELLKTGEVHGSAMRNFRLLCAFALLASALFCVFATLFFSELYPFCHDESLEEAMDGVEKIAEAYSEMRFLQAEAAAGEFLTGLNIHNAEQNPQSWLPAIRAYDPSALAVQVYGIAEDGGRLSPVKEEGDSSAFLSAEQVALMQDGAEKCDDEAAQGGSGGRQLIRIKRTVRYAGRAYAALYTSLFPQEIGKATAAAEKAQARLAVVVKAEPLSPFLGLWLYFSFILPPLLILLLCAFYVFVRLSDPLASLERSCEGLMQGKAGVSLFPQKYAGLDSTIRFVNSRSDAMDFEAELAASRGDAGEILRQEGQGDAGNGAEDEP